ncbi:putative reverse transcriptase domain-containing protein [Tanacetum coccineum]
MDKINNFQQEPDETLYQAWDCFKELLMKCPQHYLTEMLEVILFYNETNLIDQVKSNLTSNKADSNSICRIGSNQYVVSTGQNSTPLYKARQMTVPFPSRLDNHYCEEEGNYRPEFTEAFEASHINNAIPQKEKDPGSFTLPCFINDFCFDNALVDLGANYTQFGGPFQGGGYKATAPGYYQRNKANPLFQEQRQSMEETLSKFMRASVSVMPLPTYLNLGLGELVHTRLTVELADRTVKYPKRIAENDLVGIGKFTFPVDFIILDMPEDIKVPLILRRPIFSIIKRVYMLSLRERMELEDYIELNDLNEPFELRRNQGNDLMPTIEEGEVIEEFRTSNEDLDTRIDDYPSYCDDDKKIHIDCAHNLKSLNECAYLCVTFSVKGARFAVIEKYVDAYRDEGMGDVIFGEPFLREVDIKAKRFKGIITLYKGDDEVTNQMDLVKEISTNIGEEFKNLEILKCWSLETSRRLFNKNSC